MLLAKYSKTSYYVTEGDEDGVQITESEEMYEYYKVSKDFSNGTFFQIVCQYGALWRSLAKESESHSSRKIEIDRLALDYHRKGACNAKHGSNQSANNPKDDRSTFFLIIKSRGPNRLPGHIH